MVDVLSSLPCGMARRFRKGEVIFEAGEEQGSLYLVCSGSVVVSRRGSGPRDCVVDIVGSEQFFGEACLSGSGTAAGSAVVLQDCNVMQWTADTVMRHASAKPELSYALMQYFINRSEFRARRIHEGMEGIESRLVAVISILAETFGEKVGIDSILIEMPITHDLLCRCVGTSREIITAHMNTLRYKKILAYTRRHITIFNPGASGHFAGLFEGEGRVAVPKRV